MIPLFVSLTMWLFGCIRVCCLLLYVVACCFVVRSCPPYLLALLARLRASCASETPGRGREKYVRCRMTCLLIGTTLFNDSSVRWYVPTTKPIPHYVGEGTTCAKINCRTIEEWGNDSLRNFVEHVEDNEAEDVSAIDTHIRYTAVEFVVWNVCIFYIPTKLWIEHVPRCVKWYRSHASRSNKVLLICDFPTTTTKNKKEAAIIWCV